jgi:DNA-binding NtrC family response regulator
MLEVLVVEDDTDMRECIAALLEDAGHHVVQAADGAQGWTLLESRRFDVAICDVHLPFIDGLTLARRAHTASLGTAMVVMTSQASVEDAVASIRDGAVDYLAKPFDAESLLTTVIAPLADRRAWRKELEAARRAWLAATTGVGVVAESPAMKALVERLGNVAQRESCVLLHGEPGVGKRTLARMVHARSPRSLGPYVVVSAEAIDERMADRGEAATWLRGAEGGTLVIDGIDRVALAAQAALARALAEPGTEARRGIDWQPRGVRVVATAESDLVDAVAAGRFVDSLFFRVTTTSVAVPPLRERREDLLALATGMMAGLAPAWAEAPEMDASLFAALREYGFPGNVPELAWALESAWMAADGGRIEAKHLPGKVVGGGAVAI